MISSDWQDRWKVRSCDDDSGSEEELYINDQTVVWSRGLPHGTSTVVKSFTAHSLVQDVSLWLVSVCKLCANDPNDLK